MRTNITILISVKFKAISIKSDIFVIIQSILNLWDFTSSIKTKFPKTTRKSYNRGLLSTIRASRQKNQYLKDLSSTINKVDLTMYK